jgi:hypothetical protein
MLAMRDAGRPVLLGMLETVNDGPAVTALLDRAGEILAGRELEAGDLRTPAPV